MTGPGRGRSRRVALFDELRGLSVLLMILYHGLYDLVFLFGVRSIPFFSLPFQMLQLYICGSFILVSGASSRFSRSNIRRGAIVLGVGLVMTLGTALFMPDQIILFGVLHFLGLAMILHGLLVRERHRNTVTPFWGILACIVLFLLTYNLPRGYLGFGGARVVLPDVLYGTGFLFPIGLPGPNFYSSDYFPLFPWIFLFFAGSFAGRYVRDNGGPGFFFQRHSRFLGAIGKHTLVIYILHQPVLYGVLWLVFYLMGKAGAVV